MNKKAFKTTMSIPLILAILVSYMFVMYRISNWLTVNYPLLYISGTCIVMFIMLLRIIYLWEAKKDGPIKGNRWFAFIFWHTIAASLVLADTDTYTVVVEYERIGWIMLPIVVLLFIPYYFLEIRNIPKNDSKVASKKEGVLYETDRT